MEHKASAVVLIVLALVPNFEFANFRRRLLRVASNSAGQCFYIISHLLHHPPPLPTLRSDHHHQLFSPSPYSDHRVSYQVPREGHCDNPYQIPSRQT